MTRRNKLITFGLGAVLCFLVAASLYAQGTNVTVGISIPSFTVPGFTIPTTGALAAWIAAHGLILWIAMRGAIKVLDGYQAGRPWVSWIVWVLEHVSFNKNVATVAQRVVGADIPPADVVVTPAEAKAEVEAPTDNGLPTKPPASTNITT